MRLQPGCALFLPLPHFLQKRGSPAIPRFLSTRSAVRSLRAGSLHQPKSPNQFLRRITMSKALSLAVTLLALVALSNLASAQIPTCTPLSGGSGNFAFNYCVTDNGNVVQMQSGNVFEFLSTSKPREGFGVCDGK